MASINSAWGIGRDKKEIQDCSTLALFGLRWKERNAVKRSSLLYIISIEYSLCLFYEVVYHKGLTGRTGRTATRAAQLMLVCWHTFLLAQGLEESTGGNLPSIHFTGVYY